MIIWYRLSKLGSTSRNALGSVLLFLALVVTISGSFAQDGVVVPAFDDEYSRTVAKLEAGDVEIDYQAFRFSFIESEQFKVASTKSKEFSELKEQMYKLMKKSKYPAIVTTAKKMLSIDYTSMIAHKILRQTYGIMGDTVNAAKYKRIQFGLLKSITENGDGKTCLTAWPVIQLEEEFFILQMIGAELQMQHLDNRDGALCDRMNVKVDGEEKDYFFDVRRIFMGYKKLGLE